MLTRKHLMILWMTFFALIPTLALARRSENRTAKFTFPKTLFVGGTEFKPGEYVIQWDSNNPETTVTFKMNGTVVAQVQGTIVDIQNKADYNSVLQLPDSSGRLLLKGFYLSGKTFKIVFD